MKSHALYLIILLATLTVMPLYAQHEEESQQLEQAELDYHIGRFEQALLTLEKNMHIYQSDNRQKALRLAALCCLAQDNEVKAEQYARQLVEQNNYYTSMDDPVRFEEMVDRIRKGLYLKVTTASSVSESVNEAPVPVTIITAEMIDNLGYNKRLAQILAVYVPGMAEVGNGGADNISMHGAYSDQQELILVMENGHRLNDRTFNSIPLDYAISTEKIDHIEVLRGPASSLYGNVALSAVVNIITKQGADIDGIKMKYGYGSFKTHKADMTIGTRFMDADVFVWGSIFKSDGELRTARDATEYSNYFIHDPQPGHYAYADGYKGGPCYDIGLSLKLKGFVLMLSQKNSKKLYQYGEIFGYYDYDKYREINGITPGMGNKNTHAELSYTRQLGKVSLHGSVYGDWYEQGKYVVLSPEINDESWYDGRTKGNYMFQSFRERTMGGNLRGSTTYQLGSMKGNFLVGAQYEHFHQTEYQELTGSNYTGSFQEFDLSDKNLLLRENSLSLYAQDKHNFTSKLILNAGFRYDIKYRAANQTNAKAWSPRLALIYSPWETCSFKLTYSKSFVDMSYHNRIIRNYYINTEYLPQYLTAIQLNAMGHIPSLNINYDVNFFYNHYKNLYYLSLKNRNERLWENDASYKCLGMEMSATYSNRRLTATACLYWCKILSVDSYYYSEEYSRIAAVPHMTTNLNIGWKVINRPKHQLKVCANANFCGSKIMQRIEYVEDFTPTINSQRLNSTLVFDAGVKYTYNRQLQIALDCENLLNTDRFLLGPAFSMYPMHQRGRMLMGSVSITL